MLCALAATERSARAERIRIQSRVANLTGSDVYVNFRGAYVGGSMSVLGDGGPAYSPLSFTGNNFGEAQFNDANGISFRAPAIPSTATSSYFQNLQNKTNYDVFDGHTHHFYATFYDKTANGQYQAFASYEWIAQVNLHGVNQCHPVKIVDPEQRLVGMHVRPPNGDSSPDPGFSAAALQSTLGAAAARRGQSTFGNQTISQYLSRYQDFNYDIYNANVRPCDAIPEGCAILDAFGTYSSVCLSQIFVLPPVPKDTIDMTQLGMRAWGYSGYSFTGDFNGDGIADLASAIDRYIMFAPSKGDGSWQWDQLQIDTGSNQWGSSAYTWAGDFDGDGTTDLASANAGMVYMRRGSNNFRKEDWPVPNHWGSSGYTFVGDFNGDGKDDIATAWHSTVYVNLSTGTGFDQQAWQLTHDRWGSADYTWVGDFNGDHKMDLASAYGSSVFMNLSTGSGFVPQQVWTAGPWGSAAYTFIGDFNGDGRSDIASAYGSTTYLNLSTGTGFTNTSSLASVPGGSGYTRVADFNGDGKDDLLSARGNLLYLNLSTVASGTTTFSGFGQRVLAMDGWWGAAEYTFIDDFNGDGVADLATAYNGEVHVWFPEHLL